MELYIIRHGDPDYAHDSLTELGEREAEALVPRITAIDPTFIYASPLGRAQKTAMPSCRALEKVFEVLDWTKEDMAYMQPIDFFKTKDSVKFSFSEGFTEFYDYADPNERKGKLEMLAEESDKFILKHGYVRMGGYYFAEKPNKDRICVFCHGGFGSAWAAYLLGLHPMYGFRRYQFAPTAVTKIVFRADENGFCIPYAEYVGDISHCIIAGVHKPR